MKHFVKTKVKIDTENKIAEVVITTSSKTIERPDWNKVVELIIDEVENKLKEDGMNNFKISLEIKTKDKKEKPIEKLLNELLEEAIKNGEIGEIFKGFTEKGFKKAFKIIKNLETLSYKGLVDRLDEFSNNRDKMNFLFRIPIIIEINKAFDDFEKGVFSALLLIKSIIKNLELNENEAYKSPENLLKEILKANTEIVLNYSIALLKALKEIENKQI